jgi:methylthioribulose-1-phosphate dehydratase
MLSDRHAGDGGLSIEGYEMLKGLAGITTHEHREWVPILENDQDIPRLARTLGEVLATNSRAHAVLLRRHGLYTWGATLTEAERQVEILEFLFEVIGRAEGHHGAPENS